MVHSLGALPSGGTAPGNSRTGVKEGHTDATTKHDREGSTPFLKQTSCLAGMSSADNQDRTRRFKHDEYLLLAAFQSITGMCKTGAVNSSDGSCEHGPDGLATN